MGQPRERHDRVLAVIQRNSASLLRLARRHSLCADDAQDAYQRALEIYLRKLDQIDDATAGSWLRTVVKHEAMALRAQRQRYVGGDEVDLDEWISPAEDGEERAMTGERTARGAEALRTCKPDQATAMVLKAGGHSYREISSLTGWTHTKVNRSLAEGRARFLERYAAIESGAECDRLASVLSAIVGGDATPEDVAGARPHLRNCAACRAVLRELRDARGTVHGSVPAGVIAGGGGLGAIARLWDRLLAGGQTAAIKAQALLEGGSAVKVAAAAAAAAALAGGGGAVGERAAPPAAASPPRAEASVSPVTPAAAVPPQERSSDTADRQRATRPLRRRSGARGARRHELGFERKGSGAAPPPVVPSPGPAPEPRRESRSERSESFGFER